MTCNDLTITAGSLSSVATSGTVDYRLLHPVDLEPGEQLPLIVHLHGAMSSAKALDLARPLYADLTDRGLLSRCLVACASTPTSGGFYIDRPRAPGWESLVTDELPDRLAAEHGPFSATALVGASMGGYGALKIAFAEPERFAAVAAISPAVFPGETPAAVPAEARTSALGELHEATSHGTGNAITYASESVYGRARAHAERIRRAGLPVLVDCGAADEFGLAQGAEYLHRLLAELGIEHEYRLVPGAGHVDEQAAERTHAAIAFLGEALAR